jgi:hypothetical protein
VSHTCCVMSCVTNRRLLHGLTLTLLATTAALALLVFAPWRAVDAAAPAADDDPLTQHQVVHPVPLKLEQRGLPKTGDDAEDLLHWNYTFTAGSDNG